MTDFSQTTTDDTTIDEMRGLDMMTDETTGPGTTTEGMSDPGMMTDLLDLMTDESEPCPVA